MGSHTVACNDNRDHKSIDAQDTGKNDGQQGLHDQVW